MEFKFDPQKYQHASRRKLTYGTKGMVCTAQPLAAQAGLDIIKAGGNAVDAAIATAACLTVVEPTANGIGSDCFALVWMKDENKLFGLNGSGPSPMGISAEALREQGLKEVPMYGWTPVNVPGTPSGWAELSKRFGKLPLSQVLEPAARYAEEGHPVAPTVSYAWKGALKKFTPIFGDQPCHKGWFDTFIKDGKAPEPGDVFVSQGHADTLREIGRTNAESFYRGALADKIDAFSRETGGYLRKSDLEVFHAEWVEPITTNYKGYDVWEIPPNGHGIVALMALNILEGFDISGYDRGDATHKMIESMKLAFVDGMHYVTDPRYMGVTPAELLSKDYAAKRRELISDTALLPEHGDPHCGGTVYLCTADGEGNMVSYIQSNYRGFGSGVVVPGTGIALNDRGNNFTLDENHFNCLAPGKKPYHTIIPGFLTKDGKAVGPFGVMGGFMQPQGHLQVVTDTVDFLMNPQDALDAPRWQWVGGKEIHVEQNFPEAITKELIRRGHDVKVQAEETSFGRGEIIWRNDEGVLVGATEPRADGVVAAW